jgi:hypothetical protein
MFASQKRFGVIALKAWPDFLKRWDQLNNEERRGHAPSPAHFQWPP